MQETIAESEDMRVKIILTDAQLDIAKAIAMKRARKPSQYSNKFDPLNSEYWPHFMGTLGEVAFGYCYGQEPDASLTWKGDDGSDFNDLSAWPGQSVQVKTRDCERFKNPELLVRFNHAIADVYVLTELYKSQPAIVYLVGWCSRLTLIGRKPEKVGHNLNYRVPRNELTQFRFKWTI